MGSIRRQESYVSDDDDDLPLYHHDDIQEALTLTSEQMQRAREEALYVLKTNSAEEAFKIFTKGLNYNVATPAVPAAGKGGGVDKSAVTPTDDTAVGNGGTAKTQTTTTAPPPQN